MLYRAGLLGCTPSRLAVTAVTVVAAIVVVAPMALCALTNFPRHAGTSTTSTGDSTTDLLRGARSARCTPRGEPKRSPSTAPGKARTAASGAEYG
jgi:hypothetical protein